MRIVVLGIAALLLLAEAAHGEQREGYGGSGEACRAEHGLVILTEFPDVQHPVKREYARKRFFSELDGYVREMSDGKVCIKGDVTERWVTLPDPVGKYRISSRNLEVDKGRVRKLIDDALAGVGKDCDLARYSFIVVFLGARMKEYGMMGLCGFPGMLGWSSSDAIRTATGQAIAGGVAIYSYQAHLGTLFHDIAHILGGTQDGARRVPCLYDHDLQARSGDQRETFVDATVNMGFWDPLSCHFREWDLPPPGISPGPG